jgi:6-phosphofructokinase 1
MKRIGVLTSGGDAPGMNAAVRAVVRTGLDRGVEVYAIYEGYQGMVEGGQRIRKMHWNDVGGILHQGGTIIGTARSEAFRTHDGRLAAAYNLLANEIDGLVIIGGDGSLTGANLFRQEWPGLLQELVDAGRITNETAEQHRHLSIVGLVGSIDNDVWGTDITIGADTALHRITEAVDAISSTAASHQRSFVVEVMGRRCGYLALMGALATGADWALIPESPPNLDDWESKMCEVMHKGRQIGRRDSIIIVAEGATDRHGKPITGQYVRQVLEERLGEDTRVTILGHVQRGGSPSAFDRNLATLLGTAAVETLLTVSPEEPPYLMGIRGNKVTRQPLMECLERTWAIEKAIQAGDYENALTLRGNTFRNAFQTLRTLVRALPHQPESEQKQLRIAVLHAGGPAPGMNTAVRAAVRLALDRGHAVFGIYHGFQGLIDGDIHELNWMSVNGWAPRGGAELGSNRKVPEGRDFYAIARNIEKHNIEAILMIGGWAGYLSALRLYEQRANFPAFNIPLICLPAAIDNDLPGAELSVGADTALNSIVEAVDKIKQSAVAAKRVFIVEVMGRYAGYLALMSALATGAERVYLHEEGITLQDLQKDVAELIAGFKSGKRLGVMIRTEDANPIYTTGFMRALFEEEGRNLFEAKQAILGHLQQGGNPTPFDRNMATRMAAQCIDYLESQNGQSEPGAACIGLVRGATKFTDVADIPRLMDMRYGRPKEQWWMDLRAVARTLAQHKPGPALKEK